MGVVSDHPGTQAARHPLRLARSPRVENQWVTVLTKASVSLRPVTMPMPAGASRWVSANA
jgi:hypothetical protein